MSPTASAISFVGAVTMVMSVRGDVCGTSDVLTTSTPPGRITGPYTVTVFGSIASTPVESLKWMDEVQTKTYPLGELKAPAA